MEKKHEVVMMKTEEVVPYENNARKNEPAVDAVAESIKQFGFTNPILINPKHVVIAGHTRLLAAKRLGLKEVPCIVLVLTEEKEKAYRLVDNKLGELATWDFDKLDSELAEIKDIDMSIFHFDIAPIDASGFFEPAKSADDKPKNMIKCPFCGKEFPK